MAGNVKKIVLSFLALAVITSQLAGCAAKARDQMPGAPDVSMEYARSGIGQQSGDTSGTGVIGVKHEEKQPLSGDALIGYFQLTYDSYSVLDPSSQEDQINLELELLVSFCDTDGEKLPADYADQYRAWRPTETEKAPEAQAPEVKLTFTDCNETVWATGTVNLRSGPSTDDEKVGTLNKGNRVTRTGIGTGDHSDWSRVKLSDGTEVFAASSYLTTTKPSTESNQQGQQSSGQQSTESQQQQGQTSDPNAPPGGYSSDPNHGFQELTPGKAGSVANEGDVEYSGWIH